jgi:glucans biosynthesis protein C
MKTLNPDHMTTTNRRYDIDWVRVIAIGLLLIYHVAIGFQPWGIMISFIANKKSWESLWIPMMMLNVWRIPLLFFVSGMGVYFAIQNRSRTQLIMERGSRILLPFVFGVFMIVPLHLYIWQHYYDFQYAYNPNPGHLWFLGNIFIYVVILSPLFFYLKKNETGILATSIKKILGSLPGMLLVMALFILEVIIIDPKPYELYAMTWHGFFLGFIAFFVGFCFVFSGNTFWQMIVKWRWLFLMSAITLFVIRLIYFQQFAPGYILSIESNCWIISIFAFGYKYLNRPGKALDYLSQAAYPIYIIHMIVLYASSLVIFSLEIAVQLQFVLVLLSTISGCFILYEFVIRRVNFIRPLFGLKPETKSVDYGFVRDNAT